MHYCMHFNFCKVKITTLQYPSIIKEQVSQLKHMNIKKKILFILAFSFILNYSYSQITLVQPANNSIIAQPPVTIEWDSLVTSSYYKAQISTDINFNTIINTTITTATRFVFNPTITTTTKCYLRIKSNLTNWSPTYTFTFFKPSDLDSLMLWYKADDGVTVTGGSVSNWKDFSPVLNNAKQISTVSQPQLANNITLLNNKPVLRFDGSDDFLRFDPNDATSAARNRSVYLIAKYSGAIIPGSGNYTPILASEAYSNFHGSNDSLLIQSMFVDNPTVANGNIYLNTAPVLVTKLQKPFKYSILSFFPTGNSNFNVIGKDRFYNDRNWQGDYAEIISFRHNNLGRRNLIESYLRYKYAPPISLGKNIIANVTNFCDSVIIDAGNRFVSFLWNTGETTQTIKVAANNKYSVKVKDVFGIESSDTVNVFPYIKLANKTLNLCKNDTITIITGLPNVFSFLWSTNATTSSIKITQPGIYTVKITDSKNCSVSDTVYIVSVVDSVYNSLAPIIPKSDTLCVGEKLYVKSPESFDNFLWSTGDLTNFTTFNSTGQYTLTTRSALGCLHKDTIAVAVAGFAPTADFIVNSSLCQGANISFLDISAVPSGNTVASRKWNFSNGATSNNNNANPSTTFNNFGTISASLKVTTNVGCTDSIFKTFSVNKKPTASFETRLSCSGNPTQFVDNSRVGNANITTYNWLFGNNPTAFFAQNPQYEFPDQGTYSVLLKVSDENGCTDTLTQNIIVNPSPVSNFSFDSACGRTPVNFKFLASVQSPFTLLENFNWSFGDGNGIRGRYDPNNIYASPGVYSVSLAVQASNQCVDTATKQIRVFDFPIVDFTVSPTQCVNKEIQFTDISSTPDGTPINDWKWYFSGQSTSTEQNPRYAFNAQGNYTVQLTAKNLVGCVGTKLRSIAVSQAPVPQFTFTPQNGLPPLCVTYNNQSGTNGNYIWNYGDNSPSISGYNPPQHCYNSVGNYPITLVSTDFRGCTDTARKFILVDRVILDGAMVSLIITPNGDFYKVQANIVNNSNVEITALGLNLQLGGGSVIRENWTGSLLPGQATTYQFNGEIKLSESNQIPVICASIDNVNNFSPENRTDNNSTCKEVKVGQFDVLNLYPNPAYETLNFGVMLPEDGKVTIGFITTLGQLEYQLTFNGLKGYNTFSSSTIPLNAAVYVAEIMYDGQVIRKKFMRKDRK